MARITVTKITDDLDGSEGAESVGFALDGVEYTVDLNERNRSKLTSALQPFIDAGSKVSGRRGRRVARGRNDLAEVRSWASQHGFEVSERGRLAKNVLDAYEAAH